MYGYESWTLKKAEHRRIDAFELEKSLESLLDCKEIQPVHPKGSQHWLFIGRTDAEAEAPILGLPVVKSRVVRKDPDARKVWREEEKGATEDEMVGWHHQLNGHEFEQTPGGSEGQGSGRAAIPRVTKSQTRLNNWTTNHISAVTSQGNSYLWEEVWLDGDRRTFYHSGNVVFLHLGVSYTNVFNLWKFTLIICGLY